MKYIKILIACFLIACNNGSEKPVEVGEVDTLFIEEQQPPKPKLAQKIGDKNEPIITNGLDTFYVETKDTSVTVVTSQTQIYPVTRLVFKPYKPIVTPPVDPPVLPTGYFSLPLYNGIGYATLTNQSNVIIKGQRFTNNNPAVNSGNGGAGIDLYINGGNNITIENCFFDLSYNTGLVVYNATNVTIKNCLFANNNRGVYAINCKGGIKTIDNQFVNMQGYTVSGEYHRGQLVQYNTCTGPGNEIIRNRSEQFFGECYNQDLINTYGSSGTSASPIMITDNIFRGGNPSKSGGGIIGGDGGGSYITIRGNKLVNPGQYGVGVAGGSNIVMTYNEVYSDRFMWNNIGFFVAAYPPKAFGPITLDKTNKSNYKKADGSQNEYWTDGNAGFVIGGGASTGQTLASMNIPNPLITFVNENQLWELRANKTHQLLLVQEGQKSGGGNGAAPVPIDLSRPEANAGADQTTASSSVTLTSSSTPSAGNTLTGYRWVQVSGPIQSIIINPTSATANMTALKTGTYVFRLEVTQNNGDGFNLLTHDADWVSIKVN